MTSDEPVCKCTEAIFAVHSSFQPAHMCTSRCTQNGHNLHGLYWYNSASWCSSTAVHARILAGTTLQADVFRLLSMLQALGNLTIPPDLAAGPQCHAYRFVHSGAFALFASRLFKSLLQCQFSFSKIFRTISFGCICCTLFTCVYLSYVV